MRDDDFLSDVDMLDMPDDYYLLDDDLFDTEDMFPSKHMDEMEYLLDHKRHENARDVFIRSATMASIVQDLRSHLEMYGSPVRNDELLLPIARYANGHFTDTGEPTAEDFNTVERLQTMDGLRFYEVVFAEEYARTKDKAGRALLGSILRTDPSVRRRFGKVVPFTDKESSVFPDDALFIYENVQNMKEYRDTITMQDVASYVRSQLVAEYMEAKKLAGEEKLHDLASLYQRAHRIGDRWEDYSGVRTDNTLATVDPAYKAYTNAVKEEGSMDYMSTFMFLSDFMSARPAEKTVQRTVRQPKALDNIISIHRAKDRQYGD